MPDLRISNNYYYLNDDGYLASDELVEYEDNWYYVDETGAMLRNAWKEVENTDDDEDFEDTIWYYFQSSGKAYKSGKKSINGKEYIFDEDGKMLFGWIKKDGDSSYSMGSKDEDSTDWKECEYYAGEANDGVVATSAWRQIRVYDDQPETYKSTNDSGDYDYWFYFKSNGKKYFNSDDEDPYLEKKIKNVNYAFADDGHMLSEWNVEASSATDAKYFSDPESGARVTKGWFKVVPSYGVDEANSEEYDNSAKWFYADANGNLYTSQVKSLNGKKYLFNANGECQAGLKYVIFDGNGNVYKIVGLDGDDDTEDKLDGYTKLGKLLGDDEEVVDVAEAIEADGKTGVYYFARPLDTDATMKTGTCNVTVDGDSYAFKFKTDGTNKGRGINGRDGSSYYVNGRKVTADSDQKFELYEADITNKKVSALYGEALTADDLIKNTEDGTTICDGWAVVSTSGVLVKSGTKKDGDDYKIKIVDYLVTKITDADDTAWVVNTDDDGSWLQEVPKD